MPLQDYFQPNSTAPLNQGYQWALGQYGIKASAWGWSVRDKLILYDHAVDAFDPQATASYRQAKFDKIYSELKRHWQVFRSSSSYLNSTQVYTQLNSVAAQPVASGSLDLQTFNATTDCATVSACLQAISGIKVLKSGHYPWMAASKFLHFYNPTLFPIYDQAVIWNQVLNGTFKGDYLAFCSTNGLNPLELTDKFNVNYTWFAAEIIKRADPSLMPYFSSWIQGLVGAAGPPRVLAQVNTYYATAFEFIAIGAA